MNALTSERWGFSSNCFVCEPTNAAGLRIPFFHDERTETVTAEFELDDRFSGAPSYLHGGVLLAVLDEAMAWSAIALGGRWAVTGETTTRFEQPTFVGGRYRVTARLDGAEGEAKLLAAAEITNDAGEVCARADSTLAVLGETQAAEAAGFGAGQLDPAHHRTS